MIYNTIPKTKKFDVASADTETYTLIDGVRVDTKTLNKMGTTHDTAFFRMHASIDTYAWQISVGKYDAICESFDEWCELICKHKIATVWFYNAKFDFSQIDYQVLTGATWKPYTRKNLKDGYNCFESLHSAFGARYCYTIRYHYVNKNKKLVAHKFKIYDLMNIFTGGLAKLLNDFNIMDENGNKLRKLEMDYQTNKDENGNFTQDAIKYMIIDVKGLYYLIKKCNDYIETKYHLSLMPVPDFMTAGGFAKKLLLETLYKTGDYKTNLDKFHYDYIMFLSYDKMIRSSGLYQGGKCFVNYKYQNELIDKPFRRYDYNSHYPARMREGIAFKDKCYKLSYNEYLEKKKEENSNDKYIFILHLAKWQGYKKAGMLPVWYDYSLKEYTETPISLENENGLLIFEFEFEEYINYWYDLDYEIDYVIMYKKIIDNGYIEFVDMLYKDKTEGKKTKNKCQEAFSKLGLNSAYGKFAQNPYQVATHREINQETGAVHLVIDDLKSDENALMSVIQGAYITARGRVELCKSIRTYCINTPEEDFYYCDTDSIHGNFIVNADAFKIGELKLEATCDYGLFLAPKTYFEIDDNNIIELHTKGVPVSAVYNVMINRGAIDQKHNVLDINKVLEIFKAGNKFQTLCVMNLKGGKGLIPLFKELCKEDNTKMYTSNYNGQIELYEI